jgi:hypothetical protein
LRWNSRFYSRSSQLSSHDDFAEAVDFLDGALIAHEASHPALWLLTQIPRAFADAQEAELVFQKPKGGDSCFFILSVRQLSSKVEQYNTRFTRYYLGSNTVSESGMV